MVELVIEHVSRGSKVAISMTPSPLESN